MPMNYSLVFNEEIIFLPGTIVMHSYTTVLP